MDLSMTRFSLALACLALHAYAQAAEAPLLHELFSDHVVLQRDKPLVLWGTTKPRTSVKVTIANLTTSAMSDESGAWTATLAPLGIGGPYRLSVEAGDRRQQVEDVMIGDVWLCSGQSNMVLPVNRALDARSEIAGSTNDSIRMLTIPLRTSLEPRTHFDGDIAWLKAEPRNVPEFSAACFYFARELQKTAHRPMGLINSSWGGSRIEAWMSKQALQPLEGYPDLLELVTKYASDPAVAMQRWGKRWEAWWQSNAAKREVPPWSRESPSGQWSPIPGLLGPWERWGIPELARYDGMVWYRSHFQLTAAQARQRATLALGRIDEVDHLWVNGQFIGTTSGADVQRNYRIDPKVLRSGDNVIAVDVLDTYGDGGIIGSPQDRKLLLEDGTAVTVDSDWRFQQAADIGSPPRAPWEVTAGVTLIRNAMIAPLGSLPIEGAVWYQGESNTSAPGNYDSLLKGLMSDWRKQFGAELPFLIVQLANYGPPLTEPKDSGWAELREAQRLVVKRDPHAALAVAIDIGDRYDIHPANKQELGRRLARAARHLVEHESIAASGPAVIAAKRRAGKIEVTFGDVEGELIAYGARRPIGFQLCGAESASCEFVEADIAGNTISLPDAGSTATHVRYCWADSPICTLYDRSTLPAGPFDIAIQQER